MTHDPKPRGSPPIVWARGIFARHGGCSVASADWWVIERLRCLFSRRHVPRNRGARAHSALFGRMGSAGAP